MTQLPPDDRKWQEFLRKHCPTPPPPTVDLEEQLMNAIERTTEPAINRQVWAFPSAIAASLLMAWSGYRILIPLPRSSNASLEAFLENNWNEVVRETPETSQSNSSQADWILEASAVK